MNKHSAPNPTLVTIITVVIGLGCALGYIGAQNFTGQSPRQQFDLAMVGLFGSSVALIGSVFLVINYFGRKIKPKEELRECPAGGAFPFSQTDQFCRNCGTPLKQEFS